GTHSPWVSRLLGQVGHQVIVADPRRLKLISQSDSKNDRADARMLARVAAAMPELLKVVKHRSAEAQKDLTVIRARARLVEVRTKLWCSLRGLSKSLGHRLPRRVSGKDLGGMGGDFGAVVRRVGRCAPAHRAIRRTDRAIAAEVSGGDPVAADCRSGAVDIADVCLDAGRSRAFHQEPADRELFGIAAAAARLRRTAAAVANYQGRGPVFAQFTDSGRAIHSGAVRSGYGSEALGIEAGGAWREECEETSGSGGGAKAGGADASAVGGGKRVPAVADGQGQLEGARQILTPIRWVTARSWR